MGKARLLSSVVVAAVVVWGCGADEGGKKSADDPLNDDAAGGDGGAGGSSTSTAGSGGEQGADDDADDDVSDDDRSDDDLSDTDDDLGDDDADDDRGDDDGAPDDDVAGDDGAEDDDVTDDDVTDDDGEAEFDWTQDLPIPIRFVGILQPGAEYELAAPANFIDCPTGTVMRDDGELLQHPVWGDCAAELAVDEVNAAFQELLETDLVFFEAAGYTTMEHPDYYRFDELSVLQDALKALSDSDLVVPGVITATVSIWSIDLGGLASLDVPINEFSGSVLMLKQGIGEGSALTHEVGHNLGFPHSDEDPDDTGMLSYELCGGASTPVLDACSCDGNIMAAAKSGTDCTPCAPSERTFATELQGAYYKQVAHCWLETRRYLGKKASCGFADITWCEGYADYNMECLCEDGETRVPVNSCDFDKASLIAISEECTGGEIPLIPSCRNLELYPGVTCDERSNGMFECECWNREETFMTEHSCDQLTEDDVFGGCLGSTGLGTCASQSGLLQCVEAEAGVVGCMCTDTGSNFRLFSDDLSCDTIDLEVQEPYCQME